MLGNPESELSMGFGDVLCGCCRFCQLALAWALEFDEQRVCCGPFTGCHPEVVPSSVNDTVTAEFDAF
jgi:hypothetical protein